MGGLCNASKLTFFFMVVFIFAEGVDEDEQRQHDCAYSDQSKCNIHGPSIRFPFRLKDAEWPRQSVAHPVGFDLSCTAKKETMLELPNSVKLQVFDINYQSQIIRVYNDDDCLSQLIQSVHLSPFQFHPQYSWDLNDYAFFSCPSGDRDDEMKPISCLSTTPGYEIYALLSSISIEDVPLLHCSKNSTLLSLPWGLLDGSSFYLNWSTPACGDCEAQGKLCKLRSGFNSTVEGYQTECFQCDRPDPGARRKLTVAGIVLGSVILVMVVAALYHVHRSKKLDKQSQLKIEKFLEDYRALKPARYSYADIKRITDHFKDKLGEGAYGTVYKGKLSDEVFVAIKTLNSATGDGEEFINEVGTMGRIHHVNVVRLVGYCADGFRRALVYEYLPNGSLENFTSSTNSGKHLFGWEKLEDIALGIAKGIEYLHQGCDQRILHFDIKPHNILLDHNLNPKISDFGQAKLCSKEKSYVSMTAARGTIGYIAPEVFSRNFGNVSCKSDVYSFGMLLLEMVGGRKVDSVEEVISHTYFPEWVYNHLDRSGELGIQIKNDRHAQIAKKLTIVGLWCIQWYPVDRPSMRVVVKMLEGEGDGMIVPPNPFGSKGGGPLKTGQTSRAIPPIAVNRELETISEQELE
ncbi:Protein kinase domain [Dillenia turbinata]|uniref:Protein kinase domain n=1 Tax=Dillenia turbinata TaxID=194707 RepID=A0AAN8V1V8_9MAGN